MIRRSQKQAFQKKIFQWWKNNKRDLPWRHTHNSYNIFVSEVMLQQTQVERVRERYTEFIEAYPTVKDLANAGTAEILRMWKGMGYNRRAQYLLKAAKIIVQDYDGLFPKDERELIKLPGLGRYTARAILVFAYKQDIAMVDTNIRQIITHFFFHDTQQPEKIIQEVADQLVPKGKSWEWHQALMDYGALELVKGNVDRPKKKTIPFKETNRYFRGRIMDLLREKSYKEKELVQILCLKYGRDETFYMGLLQTLEKEGLVTHKRDIWNLPA